MKTLILLVFTVSLSCSAAIELFSTSVRVGLDYADLDYSCKLWPMADRFVLSAEVEDNVVRRAKLRNRWANTNEPGLELLPIEKTGMVVQKIKGSIHLVAWSLTPRLVEIFLYSGAHQGYDTCVPPHKLVSIDPGAVRLTFPTEGPYYPSEEIEFQGMNAANNHYRMRLQLELPAVLK